MAAFRWPLLRRRRNVRGLSIQDKVALVMVFLVASTVLVLMFGSARRMADLAEATLDRGEAALVALLTDQLAPTLDFALPGEASEVLASALRNPTLHTPVFATPTETCSLSSPVQRVRLSKSIPARRQMVRWSTGFDFRCEPSRTWTEIEWVGWRWR